MDVAVAVIVQYHYIVSYYAFYARDAAVFHCFIDFLCSVGISFREVIGSSYETGASQMSLVSDFVFVMHGIMHNKMYLLVMLTQIIRQNWVLLVKTFRNSVHCRY